MLVAIDLDGKPHEMFSLNWDTTYDKDAQLVQDQITAVQYLAEHDYIKSGKDISSLEIDENWVPNEAEQDLVRLIAKFPQVVEDCANKKRVHNITQYCQDLAGSFNKFYKSEQVIGSDVEDTRLILVERAKITIKNALDILGVPAPEKM